MNKLDNAKRAQIVRCLVEGNSIRSTVRMTGCSKNTIAKLLLELGTACLDYMNRTLVNLPCKLVQVDEIWSFIGCKQKQVTTEKISDGEWIGDVWTWIAIDAETKLIPCFAVGTRDADTAQGFMRDLANRMASRIQLTSDGHRTYLKAVDDAFGGEIDYAMLVKHYGANEGNSDTARRYSPAECTGCEKMPISGNPIRKHISTSYIERQNLTLRMGNRRFTRLTNAFSKKLENHIASLAIHYMHYNFVRIHQTLRMTPAMAAGVTAHLWDVEDIVALLS
jgi:IS1 family transposase